MGGSYFGSIFSITQIIGISNFKSLSFIVNILWLFEKFTLVNVTYENNCQNDDVTTRF